ncbi:hypothetical protein [Ammoniphilus sp. CFH 90114]|uniref:hypothetical protein n=1 Tax=Ammoniphilus sp. CFH 90114 TaxID=2493665 RepID=UPI00100E58B4|nr:hypothetical protein [Ammoniphilus sp. CFH 90114]RXT06314.1 hypothetical protein EIZ39_14610 [Ammoniphilus sp. CFH 90114]
MRSLPESKRRKLESAVKQLRGKTIVIRDSNGKRYQMVVQGIRGNYLVMRQVQSGTPKAQVKLFPFFFFPLPFFFPFIF